MAGASTSIPHQPAVAPVSDFATLGVRVNTVETNLHEVNDRLYGLDQKIDKLVAGLANEFRSSLSNLTKQLSERDRTPWAIIISGLGVAMTMVMLLGQLSLNPMQADIQMFKREIVPRVEHEYREKVGDDRFDRDEAWLKRLDAEMRDLHAREINDLRDENRQLRKDRVDRASAGVRVP